MRNQQRTPRTPMRMLASFLTWLLVVGQVLQPVYAVLTPLGDVPAASKVAAKPNIVYTLDDSGSMQYNYLPDFVVNAGATLPLTNITRAAAVATATGSAANIATLSVGDFVTIAGANPPEFNGYFQITGKTATTFTYTLTVIPVAVTTTVAAGYTDPAARHQRGLLPLRQRDDDMPAAGREHRDDGYRRGNNVRHACACLACRRSCHGDRDGHARQLPAALHR